MTRSFRILILALIVFLGHFSFGQYAGTYTVGGINPDFLNLDSAFTGLSKKGISGSIRLNVRSGTYIGQFIINSIKGASNTNLIKIAPDPKNTSPVILKNKNTTATENYLINVKQGFLHFDSLDFRIDSSSTYGSMILFWTNLENIKFNHCTFYGRVLSAVNQASYYNVILDSRNYSYTFDNFKVVNCTFYNGSTAILYEPRYPNQTGAEIKFNKIYNSYVDAIRMSLLGGIIEGNIIKNTLEGIKSNGINIYGFNTVVKQNQIFLKNGEGLRFRDDARNKITNSIINNFVSIYDTMANNPNAASGIFVETGDSTTLNIYNNTVINYNSNPNSIGIVFYNIETRVNCFFKNNNILNYGSGSALYFNDDPKYYKNLEMDHNNYFASGEFLFQYNNNYSNINRDFEELRNITGKDKHSINKYIKLSNLLNYRVVSHLLDRAGTPVLGLTIDIEGNKRDSLNPDIGVYEMDYYKNDLGILNLNLPDFDICGSDSNIINVIIKNCGKQDQKNFKINLEIKNDSNLNYFETINYSKTIKVYNTDTIKFKKFNTVYGGRFYFKATIASSNDEEKRNDTLLFTKIFTIYAKKPIATTDTICENEALSKLSQLQTPNSYRFYNSKVGGKPISQKLLSELTISKDTTFFMAGYSYGSIPVKAIINSTPKPFAKSQAGFLIKVSPYVDATIDSFGCYFKSKGTKSYKIYYASNDPTYGRFNDSIRANNFIFLDSGKVVVKSSVSPTNIAIRKKAILTYGRYYFYLYITDPQVDHFHNNYPNTLGIQIEAEEGTDSLFGYIHNGLNFPGRIYFSQLKDCETERVPYSIKVKELPKSNLPDDMLFCANTGDSIILDAGSGAINYLWSNTATSQKIKVADGGKYIVKIKKNGCSITDSVFVNKFSKPKINLGNDIGYCAKNGINTYLDAGVGFKSYGWNTGSNGQLLGVYNQGIYHVKVTDKNNCEAADTLIVIKNLDPIINLGNDTTWCVPTGNTIKLNAGPNYKTYKWSTGEASSQIDVLKSGYYSVSVIDKNNCTGADNTYITINKKPEINLGNDFSYCVNDGLSRILDAGDGFAFYLWSNNKTSQTISVNSAGKYFVSVKESSNCFGSDTINITSNPNPVINLGPDKILHPKLPINETLDAGSGFTSYQWSTSEKTKTINVTQPGIYYVKVIDANGCSGMDTIEIKLDPAGISVFESVKIKVYPNPAKNLLNIESENRLIEKIEVFEISGKSVYENAEESKAYFLSTANWANGMYMITLSLDGRTYKTKVSVRH